MLPLSKYHNIKFLYYILKIKRFSLKFKFKKPLISKHSLYNVKKGNVFATISPYKMKNFSKLNKRKKELNFCKIK